MKRVSLGSKFSHQVVLLALLVNAPLALVPILATRWRYLHWLQIWPPDGATGIGSVPILATRWCHLHKLGAEEHELGTDGLEEDHLRGWGKLKGEVQFRLNTRDCLQLKTYLAALLPNVYHMGELMLDKGMGKELEEPWQMINLQVIRNSGIHTISGK